MRLAARIPPGDDPTERAIELRRLAVAIESSPIVRFEPERMMALRNDVRTRMCVRLLQHNIQQLHAAAEHLREVAWTLDAGAPTPR